MIYVTDEVDPIAPTAIQHKVDELWADERGGELEQFYNYLDYHFEDPRGYCRARTYLDDTGSVTLSGPFAECERLEPRAAPELEAEVLAYLSRRFPEVKRR